MKVNHLSPVDAEFYDADWCIMSILIMDFSNVEDLQG
jgi:hypothetical protein